MIGLRREDKSPYERRVPIVPADVARLVRDASIPVLVQPSQRRAFPDAQFAEVGAVLSDDLSACPVILGIKEIPVDRLQPGKTYAFFAHVVKGQPHNMPMLKRFMDLGCQLIDYERITDDNGRRLVFFGRYAGLAGMINTLWTLGRRCAVLGLDTPFHRIRQAIAYGCLDEARQAVAEAGERIRASGLPRSLRPLVCGFAGYGNVSRGAQEVFDLLPFETVAPHELPHLRECSNRLFKVVFREKHMVEPVEPGAAFDLNDYYRNPQRYRSRFASYLPYLTLLVNGVYWDGRYPRLVTKADLKALFAGDAPPRLRVIGDITCDVGGSIECNLRTTDPGNPVYVYDTLRDEAVDGVEGHGPAVLAVDILPTELPIDSSMEFSRILMPFVPAIARADYSVPFERCALPPEVKRAMIVYQGRLTEDYRYLDAHLAAVGSRLKRILILGAGRVAPPAVRYLLDRPDFSVTVADQEDGLGESLVDGHPRGRGVVWSLEDNDGLARMVSEADVVISLLPAPLHLVVAQACIVHRRPLVTTSYVSEPMRALDEAARKAGVLLLNELGVDPGIDHMSARKVIDTIHRRGGKVVGFMSFCGGLPAPDSNDNPWGYKFSWSPQAVLRACRNGARYLRDGQVVEVPASRLFEDRRTVRIDGIGDLEAYPNRDSLAYCDLLDLREARTMLRATLRYPGWCETLHHVIALGLLDETVRDWPDGMTLAEFTRSCGLRTDPAVMEPLEWLGLLSNEPVPIRRGSPLDVMAARMLSKMNYGPSQRDMIVMRHEFIAEYPDGRTERTLATLIDLGVPGGDSAMAHTVGLPAAIGAALIAEGRINLTGVRIPVTPQIYDPLLAQLEAAGIRFTEQTDRA